MVFLGRVQCFPQPSTEVNIISFDYKYQNTKRIIKCDRNKYDNNLGKNTYLKVINIGPTDKISHSFTLMGFESTYPKHLLKVSLWKILGLSLVSCTYLFSKYFILFICFPFIRFWLPALTKGICHCDI